MADTTPGADRVRAVLFDLDGTLIDTLDLILASMRYTTEKVLGAALPDDVLMRNVGVPLIVQMRELDAEKAEDMLLVYREHNARVHDSLIKEYPGVHEALSQILASGRKLGVVTSKGRHVAEKGLALFGLQDFLSVLVTFDDVPKHKPDPYPLEYAAGQMGVSAGDCAYVGDSPFDIIAANAAGCLSIAALWGVASQERLREAGPALTAESMAQVAAMFSDPLGAPCL
jgi:pyrophosphatase PpaX